jgi:hypothetical protein
VGGAGGDRLAAGAVRQKHARDTMGQVTYDDYNRQLPEMAEHPPVFAPKRPSPGPQALGAMTANDAVAKTNEVSFSNIYPTLRFEERYGRYTAGP